MQDPINGVSLWYDKRNLILKNSGDHAMRATIKRTLTNGQSLTVEIDDNNHDQTEQIVWLAGADTGQVQMLDASKSPPDGTLNGLDHIMIEDETGVENIPLKFIRNHWSVPVYVSIDITRDNMTYPDSSVRHVIDAKSRILIYADFSVPTLAWRAAVMERSDFYQQWPPAAAIRVSRPQP